MLWLTAGYFLHSVTVHFCKINSIFSQNSLSLLSFDFRSLKSRVKILVDGTLLIPNLIPEDAGNYTCIPTNGILTPPSASAYLTVKRKTLISMLSYTHLFCSIVCLANLLSYFK